MEYQDSELIAEYLKGDTRSLEVLIRRFVKPLYSFIFRFVSSTDDAEDIVQETFFKVWKGIKKFKPESNFKTWLFTIAHNTAIDHVRRKKSLAFSSFEDADGENIMEEMLSDPEPLPDELFARAELEAMLEKAVVALAPIYREVLLLYYHEYLTFEEVSTVLGVSINTIKSRHRRALLELQKHFG